MNPEEKANELIVMFRDDPFTSQITTAGAKQCAVICVEEIIKALPKYTDENETKILEMQNAISDIPSDDPDKHFAEEQALKVAEELRKPKELKYWQSVMAELKK